MMTLLDYGNATSLYFETLTSSSRKVLHTCFQCSLLLRVCFSLAVAVEMQFTHSSFFLRTALRFSLHLDCIVLPFHPVRTDHYVGNARQHQHFHQTQEQPEQPATDRSRAPTVPNRSKTFCRDLAKHYTIFALRSSTFQLRVLKRTLNNSTNSCGNGR